MIETEAKFVNSNPEEIYYNEDGKAYTLDALQNGFFEIVAASKVKKPEQRTRFLIGVFLVDKKIFGRNELTSPKAVFLIDKIYDFFTNQSSLSQQKTEPLFSKAKTESMIRQARLQQLREKGHAHWDENEEKKVYGQTVKEFDESREK